MVFTMGTLVYIMETCPVSIRIHNIIFHRYQVYIMNYTMEIGSEDFHSINNMQTIPLQPVIVIRISLLIAFVNAIEYTSFKVESAVGISVNFDENGSSTPRKSRKPRSKSCKWGEKPVGLFLSHLEKFKTNVNKLARTRSSKIKRTL